VFINYDANDRVKRIGSVYMTYNICLRAVGGLEIITTVVVKLLILWSVKGGGRYAYNQDNDYGYDHNTNDDRDDDDNDDDHYYYRTNGTKAKIEDTKYPEM
jgi:hypothetical protein